MIVLIFLCVLLDFQVEAKDHQVNCNFSFNVSEEQEKYFNSPGFPVPGYTNNLECTYKFHSPPGTKVKVRFVQGTTERCCDKIEAISEGSLGFYSFSLDDREVISRNNNLTLIFRTDESITFMGFNASYRAIRDDTPAIVEQSTTAPQTATPSVSPPQDCNFTFTVNGDEINYFHSPGFPLPGYRHNLDCTYNLVTLPGRRIEVEFVEGKTESCCDIIEANSAGSVSFHGGVLDGTEVFSRDNHLTLNFKTDHSVKFKGFNASYSSRAITCYPTINAPTNGEILCTNTNKLNSVCTYTCNEGYALTDSSLKDVFCNDNGDDDDLGEWSSDPPDCTDFDECTFGTHNCDGDATCTNTEGSFTCECNTGFIGNGLICENIIKQTIDICGDDEPQGYNGFLTSPNFPEHYGNYHDCSKFLSPPVGKRVEIGFLIFELEDDDGTEEGRCLYDSLTMVVGEEQFSGVKYCGNVAPYNFTTNQEVTFNFVVDHSKSLRGFQIFWKMVDDCDETSYRCWDGSCIPASKRCDGVPDCPNQRDEIECVHPTSSYGECGKNSAPAQFVWEKKTTRRQSLLQRKSRVVGGHSARSKSYPWTVPLFVKNETSQTYICVASIISERWLITAAHCVNGRVERDLFGLLGTNDKSDFDSTKVQFGTIVTHPNYSENRAFLTDDIALLRTTKPIVFDDKVNPVCIPDQDVPQSDICIGVGWGLFYKGSTRYPDLLHQTPLPLLNNSLCRRAYPDKTDDQICAGDFESGGRDTCQGDSGGPLLCFQNNSWFQFGVTSTGAGCGTAQSPGIYTNVRSYYDWIQHEIQSCNFSFNVTNEEESIFTSPRYPSEYYNFLSCTYSFVAPRGRKIKISFIEGRTEKCCDKIKVISEEASSFSGELSGKEMISRDNSLILSFETDRSTTDKGFKAHYRLL